MLVWSVQHVSAAIATDGNAKKAKSAKSKAKERTVVLNGDLEISGKDVVAPGEVSPASSAGAPEAVVVAEMPKPIQANGKAAAAAPTEPAKPQKKEEEQDNDFMYESIQWQALQNTSASVFRDTSLEVEAGNYFLYECPRGAKSWEHELAQRMDAHLVEGPMCKWKVDESGKLIAGQSGKKRTRWITNSATVATALEKLCKDSGKVWNRELSFKEGIVQAKAEYPPKLERAVLAGVRAQLVLDGEMSEVGHVGGPDPHEEPPLEEYLHESLPKAGELYVKEPVIDANTGAELDPRKVAEARASELAWVKKQGVYEKVDDSICWSETGRPPITLKWVDCNKGEDVKDNFRSRLVVREVKSQGQAALIPDYARFSSMPPLEGLKILCSLLTSMKRSYTTLLKKHGFQTGKAYPCTFYHAGTDVRLLVHGDDFLVLADEDGHRFVDKILSEEYEFKCDGHIGPGCLDVRFAPFDIDSRCGSDATV
ncbi:unnamed protein product [Symbiodinium sp. CCMP2592]|nr:unnamed protein product [Symbiodinium sp. CCMP2592]